MTLFAANALQCIVNGEEIPQNPFPLRFRHRAGRGPSYGHIGNMLKKFGKDCRCGSRDILSDRQTHRQTDRQTQQTLLITMLRHHSRGRSTKTKRDKIWPSANFIAKSQIPLR